MQARGNRNFGKSRRISKPAVPQWTTCHIDPPIVFICIGRGIGALLRRASARRGVVETKTLPSSPRSLPARLRARSTDVRGSVPMFLSCSSSAREMARAGHPAGNSVLSNRYYLAGLQIARGRLRGKGMPAPRSRPRAGGSDSCLMECRQGRTRSGTLALVARHVDNLCHTPAPASLGPPISPMNRRFRSAGGTEPYDYIHFVILDFFPPRL